jgi:hypothetical protein
MGQLDRIANTAQKDPFFLGWWLERFRQAEGLDDAGLMARLGCRPEQLTRLRLCRFPRQDAAGFREDVTRICEAYALEPSRLAVVVRRAAVLVELEAPAGADEPVPTLMAARDAEEAGP